MTGRFPVRAFASAKMCSRFGIRRAEMQLVQTSAIVKRRINPPRVADVLELGESDKNKAGLSFNS